MRSSRIEPLFWLLGLLSMLVGSVVLPVYSTKRPGTSSVPAEAKLSGEMNAVSASYGLAAGKGVKVAPPPAFTTTPAFADPPIETGLVAYYKFDEGLGSSTADSSGNSLTGQLLGPTWSNTDLPDILLPNLNALSFNGTSDSVLIPPAAINDLRSGTITAWVYLNTRDQEVITAKQDNRVDSMALFAVGRGFCCGAQAPGVLYFHARNATGFDAAGVTALNTGQWYHVGVTFTATQAKIYVNGILDSTTNGDFSVPSDLNNSAITSIGAWLGDGFSGTNSLDGRIDEVRIYDRALSDSEMEDFVTSSHFFIRAITANKGENTSDLSVSVLGGGFPAGATVKLTAAGQPDIEGANPIVVSPSRITTTFNLRGAVPGLRDAVVTLLDGSTAMLSDGFTIEEGGKAPPTNGLVAYYKFDEGLGSSTADSSGNSLTGQLLGPTWSNTDLPDILLPNLNALSFNGTSDSVLIPPAAINDLRSGTITAWVYLNTRDQEVITAKQDNRVDSMALFAVGRGFCCGAQAPGVLYFHARNATGFDAAGVTALNTGQWYHVGVTFTATQAKIYVNGILDSTTNGDFSVPSDLNNSAITSIGAWLGDGFSGTNSLDGQIDEVRIYDRALSDSEMEDFVTSSHFFIRAITANKGGNSGGVSVSVLGGGFPAGATVKLTAAGQPDIEGANPIVVNRSRITTTFNLLGATPGLRDVVVTLPDNSTATFRDGFTIEVGGAAQVWVDVVGRDTIRLGRPQTYSIIYGNRGNVNIHDVLLFVRIPKGTSFSIRSLVPPAIVPPSELNFVGVELNSEILIPIWFYVVPAGFVGSIQLDIRPGTVTSEGVFVRTELLVPPPSDFSRTGDFSFTPHHLDLLALHLAKAMVNAVLGPASTQNVAAKRGLAERAISADNCGGIEDRDLLVFCTQARIREAFRNGTLQSQQLVDPYGYGAGLTLNVLAAAAWVAAPVGGVSIPFAVSVSAIAAAWDIYGLASAGQALERVVNERSIRVVASLDPNDKVGSVGIGNPHYLSGDEPLRYAVYFENIPTASAPAQDVVVTDQLDVANLQLSTFSFGPIGFNNKQVSPPQGVTDFTTNIDLRPDKNLIVKIDAHLQINTGLLTWRFISIDPDTGLPTDDPLAGFLQPGGEGNVVFTVSPKPNLPTGTVINNAASIIFDNNPAIQTPTWSNTLDNSAPVSSVHALTATPCSANLNVQWSSTDTGSGIRHYTVYVSDNAGPFTIWQRNAIATSGTYAAQFGHTYAFYSVAQDQTGNIEKAPPNPDATVTLSAPAPPTFTRVPPAITVYTGQGAMACAAFVTDAVLGTAIGGSACSVSVRRSGVPNGNIFPVGNTTITYAATDALGNTASATQIVTVADKTPPLLTVPSLATASTNTSCQAVIPAVTSRSTAPDNCGGAVTLTQNPAAGTLVGPGPHAITVTATDAAGNSKSVTTTFTVVAGPSFTVSVTPSSVKRGNKVTFMAAFKNCASTRQTLTLKVSLTRPGSNTLMATLPVVLQAGQADSLNIPLTIPKSTPTGLYSLTLDVYVGGIQIGTSTAQLTVIP